MERETSLKQSKENKAEGECTHRGTLQQVMMCAGTAGTGKEAGGGCCRQQLEDGKLYQ